MAVHMYLDEESRHFTAKDIPFRAINSRELRCSSFFKAQKREISTVISIIGWKKRIESDFLWKVDDALDLK